MEVFELGAISHYSMGHRNCGCRVIPAIWGLGVTGRWDGREERKVGKRNYKDTVLSRMWRCVQGNVLHRRGRLEKTSCSSPCIVTQRWMTGEGGSTGEDFIPLHSNAEEEDGRRLYPPEYETYHISSLCEIHRTLWRNDCLWLLLFQLWAIIYCKISKISLVFMLKNAKM